MKANQSGLTLIELIITLSIIAILCAVAFPSWQQQRAQIEQKRTLYDLTNLIRQAKLEARLRHRNVLICPLDTSSTCQSSGWSNEVMMFVDLNQNWQFDTSEPILQRLNLNLNYASLVWKGSLSRPYLQFQGDTGLPRGLIGHFLYCSNSSHSFKLTLNMMGHTRHESISPCS